MIRVIFFLFLCFTINNCGFKPMYQSDGNGVELNEVSLNFKGAVTYEIREELKNFFGNNIEDPNYIILVEAREEIVPVIMNENGTVSKYQIDIVLFFDVTDKFGDIFISDVAVGFAQYDVLVSEIENKDLRKQMLRSATNDAASLMITKIQSKLSLSNDN